MSWLWRSITYIGYLIIVLIGIALVWAAAAWLHGDDQLSPEFASFYAVDKSHAYENNAAIAVLGLSAPADVTDSYGWALQLVKQSDAEKEKYLAQKKGAITSDSFDASVDMVSRISQVDTIPNRMDFLGETNAIGCLLGEQYIIIGEPPAQQCDEKALLPLTNDNALLLRRYEAMLKYDRYDDHWPITGLQGRTLIKLQEIYVAGLVATSRTDPVAALQQALANMRFYRRAIIGHTKLIDRSILMVNYGLVQKSLPSILSDNEALITAQLNSLLDALPPFGAGDVNIAALAKAEYETLSPIIDQLGNYNRNKTLQFHKGFITAWNTPPMQADAVWEPFFKHYKPNELYNYFHLSDWHSPKASIVTNLVLGGMAMGADLAKAQNAIDARSRILNLYVQIKAMGVAPEEMQPFLNSAPKSLYNPFTDTPMQYDAANTILYFTRRDGYKEGFRLIASPVK